MSIRNFARTVALAGFVLAAAGAANADVFMKVANAPGDATQRGFEDQVLLTGASLSILNMVTPDPEGLAEMKHETNVGNIMLTKAPDRSSPKLMMAAVNSKPLGTIEITFTSPGKPGQGQVIDAKWIIEGAEVRAFNVFPDTNGGAAASENVEISYTSMRYQHFSKDGKGGRTMEEVKWNVPEGQIFAGDEGCR